MLDAIKNIQRMEADIITKYAESNAWLDELDASWMDDEDLPLEFQDGVSMTQAASLYAQQAQSVAGTPRDEDAAHAALLSALGL